MAAKKSARTVPATPAAEVPAPDTAPTTPAAPAAPVMTPEALAEALLVIQDDAARAKAEADLRAEIEAERERRAKIDAELAKRQATETTRAALAALIGAATAAYATLAGDDEAATAAALEKVTDAAYTVRRAGKVPTRPTGTTTPGGGTGNGGHRAAPSPLKPLVAAHLAAHPDKDFTPGEIAKVLGRSSGAVGNALQTMAKNGEAVLTSEKPMRYRHAIPTTEAPDAASADESADAA